jgi:hypothetical protein
MALVVSLAFVGEFLGWPPQILVPAFFLIFGATTLLQVILGREASRSDRRPTG